MIVTFEFDLSTSWDRELYEKFNEVIKEIKYPGRTKLYVACGSSDLDDYSTYTTLDDSIDYTTTESKLEETDLETAIENAKKENERVVEEIKIDDETFSQYCSDLTASLMRLKSIDNDAAKEIVTKYNIGKVADLERNKIYGIFEETQMKLRELV